MDKCKVDCEMETENEIEYEGTTKKQAPFILSTGCNQKVSDVLALTLLNIT